MKRFFASILSVAVIFVVAISVTACDKFQGKTFEFAGVDVAYITEINEEGIVTKYETLPIDSYCKDILGIQDLATRNAKIEELKTTYGIVNQYYKFSRTNEVRQIREDMDELTGSKISEVVLLTYALEGNAMQITRSELDENGCGLQYTERIEIITSSQLQKYHWGTTTYESRFTEEDVTNHTIYRLVVNYMSY